jgi:hypothetical protein
VGRALLAPLAIFFELYFPVQALFLAGIIIRPLAVNALELYEIFAEF